jgi:hypothetical protein
MASMQIKQRYSVAWKILGTNALPVGAILSSRLPIALVKQNLFAKQTTDNRSRFFIICIHVKHVNHNKILYESCF